MLNALSNLWREDSDALDKKLAKAVLDGNAGQVDSLLKRGAYVNAVISVDDFPTSEYMNVREADTLNPTSIGAVGAPWGRVVQHAYIKRDIPVMMALIHAGAELRFASYVDDDDSQYYMRSIVLHAATQNDREMLDWFIRGGVDLNAHKSFENNTTALQAVCEGGGVTSYFDRTRPDVISFLVLQRFCDVNVQSGYPGWKMTNAHACVFDKGTTAPLNLVRLMENFLDINVFEGSEEAHFSVLRVAMVKASEVAQPAALRARRRTIVELILEYNVDFDYHDLGDITDGDDPDISRLVEAKRHEQSVVYLRGVAPQHINDVDRWGKTALHRAAENGQYDQLRILLEKGARIDTRDNMGRKPHDSARHRHNRYAETIKYNASLSNDPGTPYRFHRSAALTLQKMAAFKRIYKYLMEVQNMKRVHAQYEAFHQQPAETRTEAPDEIARMYYRLLPQHLREVQSMLLGDEAS
jgi:hypothetical protein